MNYSNCSIPGNHLKKMVLFFFFCLPLLLLAQGNLNLSSLPLQISFNEGTSPTYTFSGTITNIVSRNPDVISWTISGNNVTFTGLKARRTGLKIESGGQSYYMGVRINHANGTIPGLPQYLSIGSVSEDVTGDLTFWKDIDTDATNKAMDIRYIYINGGAINGWQTWGAQRPGTFARESLRHGLIPFFVYYNIPDVGESYQLDLEHAQDPAYMTAYFKDLNVFMDSVQNVMNGDLYGIILEPDFLGYMQQNAVPNNPHLIPTSVGPSAISTNAGTIASLVHRINKTISDKRISGHKLFFGWQLNLWAYGAHAGSKGILRKSDELNFEPAKYLIGITAQEITQYGINAGILSYNADFISIDKYGLDAMGQNNTPDPFDCTWFFNNDHWNNYLLFANKIYTTSGKPVILWQLPVGRINQSNYQSAYTGQTYPDVNNTPAKYEDSSTDFFLGDNFLPTNTNRINYFKQNKWNDPKLNYNSGTGILQWGNHLQETKDKGIISVLFGAGVGASTDGIGNPPSDNYFWIQKVQDYYSSGTIPLSSTFGEDPLNPCVSGCNPTIQFISPINGGKIVRSELDSAILKFWINDRDGTISTISITIDGQPLSSPNLNDLQVIAWTPPSSFGFHTLSVTVTDNQNNKTTGSITFELVDFDATACGKPEWSAAATYSTAGTLVSYNGLIYKNKWYTIGDKPYLGGPNSPWELEGICDALLTGSNTQTTIYSSDFQIVPNPAGKKGFWVWLNPETHENTEFSLIDMNGKTLSRQNIGSDKKSFYWEIKDLAKGIYIVQTRSEKGAHWKKLIIGE